MNAYTAIAAENEFLIFNHRRTGQRGDGQGLPSAGQKANEEVALKLIKPEIASDKKTLERFSFELKTARKIVHTHIGRM